MKTIKIIGSTQDLRTKTSILYAQIDISEYLELVGKEFDRFDIQRKRVNPKSYSRLKKDIRDGALLPPITLAINPQYVSEFGKFLAPLDQDAILKRLDRPENIYILDGLQRTHIINDIATKDGVEFKEGQKLLLEIWFEPELTNLIYRLIVLNAGQKPMSMRHQIELLFVTIKDQLEQDIEGLEIYKEKDSTVRNKPMKFAFDKLVTAYYSFILKTPEISREHIVQSRMEEASILDSDEHELANIFIEYESYLREYCYLDRDVYRIYSNSESNKGLKNLLSEENFINSFFAVLSQYGEQEKTRRRIKKALSKLQTDLAKADVGEDVLALDDYQSYRAKIDPKAYNVGFATRKLITNALKEYFREEGDISFKECWSSSYEFLRERV